MGWINVTGLPLALGNYCPTSCADNLELNPNREHRFTQYSMEAFCNGDPSRLGLIPKVEDRQIAFMCGFW